MPYYNRLLTRGKNIFQFHPQTIFTKTIFTKTIFTKTNFIFKLFLRKLFLRKLFLRKIFLRKIFLRKMFYEKYFYEKCFTKTSFNNYNELLKCYLNILIIVTIYCSAIFQVFPKARDILEQKITDLPFLFISLGLHGFKSVYIFIEFENFGIKQSWRRFQFRNMWDY